MSAVDWLRCEIQSAVKSNGSIVLGIRQKRERGAASALNVRLAASAKSAAPKPHL
jgi:hypothetical protein